MWKRNSSWDLKATERAMARELDATCPPFLQTLTQSQARVWAAGQCLQPQRPSVASWQIPRRLWHPWSFGSVTLIEMLGSIETPQSTDFMEAIYLIVSGWWCYTMSLWSLKENVTLLSQTRKSSFPPKKMSLSSEHVFLHFNEDPVSPFIDLLHSVIAKL